MRAARLCPAAALAAAFVTLSARAEPPATASITPIFGQLVMYTLPPGFMPRFEDNKRGQYIQESVPNGETVEQWTQIVTVTGAQGLGVHATVTPQLLLNRMAQGFQTTCPTSFTAQGLGDVQITGAQSAFLAVISCGTSGPANAQRSETAVVLSIKGVSDVYTIQWAERGPASATPLPIDRVKWMSRIRQLTPIKLCAIVPDEAPPYPSCSGHP